MTTSRKLFGAAALVLLLSGCGAGQTPSVPVKASASASAPRMTEGQPPGELLARYHVPAPNKMDAVSYRQRSDLDGGSFYLEVSGDEKSVDEYLKELGTARAKLTTGYVPITTGDQKEAGWSLDHAKGAAGASVTVSSSGDETVTGDLVVTSAGAEQHLYLVATPA